MIKSIRLIQSGALPAAANMALDQAVLESHARADAPPTLRLYRWSPPAVSVGYFQSLEAEVDVEAARRLGVDLVRRITGGGAVFHQHEITYTFIAREDLLGSFLGRSIQESYERLCEPVVTALRHVGLDARFAPVNDILAGGRKVSGSAQTRKLRCVLQHGTLLLDLDPVLMFQILKVPKEKAAGKSHQESSQRVTSVSDALGREATYEEFARLLPLAFADVFCVPVNEDSPSTGELARAERIEKEKFSDWSWTARR